MFDRLDNVVDTSDSILLLFEVELELTLI